MKKTFKKSLKIILLIIAILFVGGISSIVTDKYIFPYLSSTKFCSQFEIFKNANKDVTVINKTEQVTIREDDSVNKIASRVSTSVVNIISIADKKTSGLFSGEKNKQGTGVMVTNDGLVVTYRDAILEKDASYKILIFNGQSYDAEFWGVDEFTNLAYLKINASNLPAASFSNSNDFYPGKKLIAIGNSFEEYQNRFSAGLLSNVNKVFNIAGKSLSVSEKLEGVFETDFLSQEEYLGGPVIDYNGDLVGIIGRVDFDGKKRYFQIPSNVVKESMMMAINKELEFRPYFGAYYIPITKAYSISSGLNRDRGALIYSASGKSSLAIISGSPAEKAGIHSGDIIIAVNGQEINLDNSFSNLISKYKKGEKITLLVIRNEKEISIGVQL